MTQTIETRSSTRPTAPPLGVVIASGLLALAGLGIAIYLTIAHFVGTQILACVSNGAINCEYVTTSAQSHFLGMPVSVLGLAYFVVAVPLYSPWAWWSRSRRLHVARIVVAVLGMCFVLWLLTAELVILHKICLWCSGVHVVTFLLFSLTLGTAQGVLSRDDLTG
jgi:uncharacterized membrane protein